MCPACMLTVAWVAAGATSTAGLTALVVKKFQAKTKSQEKRSTYDTQNSGEYLGPSEDRFTR